MSFKSTWGVVTMNDCGCDMYISAPYLQSKFTNLSPQTTMMSGDTVPAWAEIKVKVKPSLVSLLLYLVIGHIFGGIILFWRSHSLTTFCHVFISIIIVLAWLHTTIREVIVLVSRPLGVQCSCRYLSGRWRRSSLIPTRRIRTVHLLDRVTNASVTPHLFLELRRSSPSFLLPATSTVTDEMANAMLCLQPLFSVPVDDSGDEEGKAASPPLCCLPLQSLVTVYRLMHAVIFRETVPCAF